MIAGSILRLADDVDVPTLSSTWTPRIELRFTSSQLSRESCVEISL